jgi:hypothetical protein
VVQTKTAILNIDAPNVLFVVGMLKKTLIMSVNYVDAGNAGIYGIRRMMLRYAKENVEHDIVQWG